MLKSLQPFHLVMRKPFIQERLHWTYCSVPLLRLANYFFTKFYATWLGVFVRYASETPLGHEKKDKREDVFYPQVPSKDVPSSTVGFRQHRNQEPISVLSTDIG